MRHCLMFIFSWLQWADKGKHLNFFTSFILELKILKGKVGQKIIILCACTLAGIAP